MRKLQSKYEIITFKNAQGKIKESSGGGPPGLKKSPQTLFLQFKV